MNPIPLHHVWQYTDVDRAFWAEHLEGWVPRRVFDPHTHVQDKRFCLEPMTEDKRRQYWVNEVFEPIGAEDAQRCYGVVFPGRELECIAFGSPSLDFDIEASNRQLQEECSRRGWHSLAVVRPQWTADRLREELAQPTVLGVKVYYALIGHDTRTRDKYLEASIFDFLPHHQLELLDERGAWVALHVPRAGRLGHPANIAEIKEIRRRYPRVVLVVAHLGRCYTLPHAQEAFPPLADDEGLYFDLSGVLNGAVHRLALATFGPRRLLYATDGPIFYMRGRRTWEGRRYINHTNYPFHFNKDRESPEVEAKYTLYLYEALRAIRQACEELSLDRAAVEDIFHGNAERLVAQVRANSNP